MKTLDISSALEGLCNLLPVASSVDLDSLRELLILSLSPVAFG